MIYGGAREWLQYKDASQGTALCGLGYSYTDAISLWEPGNKWTLLGTVDFLRLSALPELYRHTMRYDLQQISAAHGHDRASDGRCLPPCGSALWLLGRHHGRRIAAFDTMGQQWRNGRRRCKAGSCAGNMAWTGQTCRRAFSRIHIGGSSGSAVDALTRHDTALDALRAIPFNGGMVGGSLRQPPDTDIRGNDMDELVKGLDEKGFSFLETIFAVSVLAVLGSAAVFHGSSIYRNTILSYETAIFVSDMKLIQQMSRTATYDSSNFPSMEKSPQAVDMTLYSGCYYLKRSGGYGNAFRKHYYSPDIGVTPTGLDYLSFYPNGNTRYGRMGNLLLFSSNRGSIARKIIVDKAGRVRVDRRKI